MEELITMIGAALLALGVGIGVVAARRRKARDLVAHGDTMATVERAKHEVAVEAEANTVDAADDELAARRAEVAEVEAVTDPDARSDALADLLNKRRQ